MLCIALKPGEYFTVGDSVVVQFDRLCGGQIHLTIDAPKEVPVLRGKVLERNGGTRPACVKDPAPPHLRFHPADEPVEI